MNQLQHDKFIGLSYVMDMTGKSRASIYADMKAKRFPQNIKISERSARWRLSDVISWMDSFKVEGNA